MLISLLARSVFKRMTFLKKPTFSQNFPDSLPHPSKKKEKGKPSKLEHICMLKSVGAEYVF